MGVYVDKNSELFEKRWYRDQWWKCQLHTVSITIEMCNYPSWQICIVFCPSYTALGIVQGCELRPSQQQIATWLTIKAS